jgi:hypothetical protein
MKTLAVVALILLGFAQPANSGLPDPANSFVMPWDDYGQAFMSPGLGGDSLLVLVRDSQGALLTGVPVEIDISDCSTLCVDFPDGLSAVTFNGVAVFDPRVGGCETCDVVVRAGDVVLRTFSNVVSADWNGSIGDGYTDISDLFHFVNSYPSPPRPYDDCLDYNGDSVIDRADSLMFAACFAIGNTYPCDDAPCLVTPPGIDFGTVAIGDQKQKTFRITNTGSVVDTLRGAVSDTCLSFVVLSGAGPYEIISGESLIVTVEFVPFVSGLDSCVVGTGEASCLDVVCYGTGDDPPACLVEPPNIDFGAMFVGEHADTTFIITNSGGGTLDGTVDEACAHYSILSGFGPFSLAADETLTVAVRFQPAAGGTHPCTIATQTPLCSDVSLTGVGQEPPACVVYPDSVDFGTVTVGISRDTTFFITNTGGGTIAGTVGEACAHYSIVSGGGPYALAAAETLVVTVRFEPTAIGTQGCAIETGDALCSDVICSGIGGPPPECAVAPDSLDFGTVSMGGSSDLTFTVLNTGGGLLNGSISEPCSHYSLTSGGGPYSLAASETLTVMVRFEPTAEGTFTCTVETGQPLCSDVHATGAGGAEPSITSIADVGNDQGRNVRITWQRCAYDAPGDSIDIVSYGIYRRQDLYLAGPRSPGAGTPALDKGPQIEGWDFAGSVPARGDEVYQYVAPTLCDSTISQGMCWTVFQVSAMTPDPLAYYDSAPDSGYSLDNLAPSVPDGFSVAYNSGSGNQLLWEPSPDEDFQYFKVYRGTDPDFTPSPGNMVEATTETAWTDSTAGVTEQYKISAVDFAGNESDATSPRTVTAALGPAVPDRFDLHQNVPNPFNPTTTIHYDVPAGGGMVTVRVYDVHGRLVRTLIDGQQSSGQKTVVWNGRNDRGQIVATGVYFYRMTAPGFDVAKKMVLLQ